LESLTGDIVVMGGYRGSILRSAKPPHRRLWVPVKVQLGVRKVNLEVGLDPEDEENMEKSIIADGMLQNVGPVDISRRLFKKLRECENARTGKLRVHDYGYDWRLSPHLLSRKLVEFLEKLPSNQPGVPAERRGALVIAHSLGGLITRHAVNQRPDLFSGVLYAGVPQRCVNILGPLRNGDAVLLNEKILTAQVNFSLRTTFVFLPEDGFCFVDKATKEEYRVDFYNVEDWIKYRWSPCVSEPPLPALSRSSTFGSLLSLSDSLPSLPLRGRSNTQSKKHLASAAAAAATADITHAVGKDRTLAPQMGSSSAASNSSPSPSPDTPGAPKIGGGSCSSSNINGDNGNNNNKHPTDAARARNIAYLARTLAETKRFRAELAHRREHQEANAYPPLAVIYAKDIPTTYAARVASRAAIACADAYDDLVFASGDGVVLAREAMLPPGYELVRGGRVCTDRGHITMLGDLAAVGRGLEALVRGRRKGIGLGRGT
jgi:pimeloyl-ACP methyl ester carboxylesterase